MDQNSLFELFSVLIFMIIVLYYNNRMKKYKSHGRELMIQMYKDKVNIICCFAIIIITISILKKLM